LATKEFAVADTKVIRSTTRSLHMIVCYAFHEVYLYKLLTSGNSVYVTVNLISCSCILPNNGTSAGNRTYQLLITVEIRGGQLNTEGNLAFMRESDTVFQTDVLKYQIIGYA